MSADHPAPASPANDAEPVVITVDAADPRYGFGVDVGGSGVKGGIVDLKTGELVGDRFKITTPQPATPDAVAATVAQIVDHFGWTGRVGITLPSVVAGRIVRSAANIDKAWIGIDPYELFGRHLSSPALSVLNDADAAGLAEVEYGTNDDAVDGVSFTISVANSWHSVLFRLRTTAGVLNTIGGKLLPFDYVQAATNLAKERGLNRHLDGARLFNAATAQAERAVRAERVEAGGSTSTGSVRTELTLDRVVAEARAIAQCFDSVSVCFSKGLGAPVGSALCGSRELIARAHRVRKMAGGGMRQAGLLAAAASYALDHHVLRLADDHALAQRLATGLTGIDGLAVEVPQSNIVFVDLEGAARSRSAALLAHLAAQGIRATGLYRLRFVTHLDVDAAGIDRAVAAIRQFFATAS